jgi:hypothetical protein
MFAVCFALPWNSRSAGALRLDLGPADKAPLTSGSPGLTVSTARRTYCGPGRFASEAGSSTLLLYAKAETIFIDSPSGRSCTCRALLSCLLS